MSENRVDFTINIGGNAYKGSAALDAAMGKLNITATKTTPLFDKIGVAAVKLNSIFQLTKSVVGSVTNAFSSCVQANQAQQEAETKLARVMRNTMAASNEQIESIKALTSAQHQKKCSRTNMWLALRSSSAAAADTAKLSWGAE